MNIDVALPLPVDRPYTYEVPDSIEREVAIGCRVVVPFGNRQLTGVVVGISGSNGVDKSKLKAVDDVLDDEPALTEELLDLTRWVADYYVCGWGEAIRAALPPGASPRSDTLVTTTGKDDADLSESARALLGRVGAGKGPVSLRSVRREVPVTSGTLRRLEEQGYLHLERRSARQAVGVRKEKVVALAPAIRRKKAFAEAVASLRGERQRSLLHALKDFDSRGVSAVSRKALMEASGASTATVRRLAELGLVTESEREIERRPETAPELARSEPVELHSDQRIAVDAITSAVETGAFKTFLLHGVTGSGKTEVYLCALEETVQAGRTAIILVPEIALTPQTVARFSGRFPGAVAVLHSRMSTGERYDAWRGLRSGKYRIAVGARSALFAPVQNLGLIVVDEEHEPSYKQFEPDPRYQARDLAVLRAQRNNAVCVLGSATPSLESWVNARRGKYTLLSMPERVPVAGAPARLPEVEVVDLTVERKKHRVRGPISTALYRAIQERLERKEQVILLQNRRGYSPVITCDRCGWSQECPACSVTMTYHKTIRRLRCHYCGITRPVPAACGSCGSENLEQLGSGTQRIEEELSSLFDGVRILRMDLDTTRSRDGHQSILKRFGAGKADILLGTQMVAKGLDFGRVSLVGVVDADVGMLLPDFRSEERTFQLLTQVAGRAGRASLPGEVILQTRNPTHPAITFAIQHDYIGFAEYALRFRKELHYPPFGQFTVVLVRGPNERRAHEIAQQWARGLADDTTLQVLGPTPAFISRIKDHFRFQVTIKSRRAELGVQQAVRRVSEELGAPPKGYHVAFDVDAMGLM